MAPEPSKLSKRWLETYHTDMVGTNDAPASAGRVYLKKFEVPFDLEVDAVVTVNGDSVAGSMTVGIYGPVVTEETCLNAPLAVESASTAISGTTAPQTITFNTTRLRAGRYYVALEYSDTTSRYLRHAQQTMTTGWTQFYDRGGGYGALTNPCPAVTNAVTEIPASRIRVVS